MANSSRSRSLVATLLVLFSCCSVASSGFMAPPVKGDQQNLASAGSQSHDSNNGYYRSYTVTARQCSVIRRYTQFDNVHVPFLCNVLTGRATPLPFAKEYRKTQVTDAMKAGGWSTCYRTMAVPMYRFQRIPVCCPGTIPAPNGGCVNVDADQLVSMPTFGHEFSQPKAYTGYREPARAQAESQQTPAPSTTPIVVQVARPYRRMMGGVPPTQMLRPGSLMRQFLLSTRQGGPAYTTEDRGGRVLPPLPALPASNNPELEEWQKDLARYLAAIIYQKMLVEQQEKMLQEEINRQHRLRQQMEYYMAQQRRLVQQLQDSRRLPGTTSPHGDPRADPRPIPSPPDTSAPSTPSPEPVISSHQLKPTDNQRVAVNAGGLPWSRGILDKMPFLRQPASNGPNQLSANGPTNMPSEPQSPQVQILRMKEKVKMIIDGCLVKSNVTNPMEKIIMSRDLNMLRPICRASDKIGPCVMSETHTSLGQDQISMIGRQMVQSLLMALGRLCLNVQGADRMSATVKGEMTSPPVFPNSAPSMTNTEVTKVSVEKKLVQMAEVTKNEHGHERARAEVPVLPPGKPIENPAATAIPHVEEKELELPAQASFPMWMILTLVGACAGLLLISCLIICLVLRFRRKKKSVELDCQPEKLPVPASTNIYSASPCVPPPAYITTIIKQSLGGEDKEDMDEQDFKIPEDDGKLPQGASDGQKAEKLEAKDQK